MEFKLPGKRKKTPIIEKLREPFEDFFKAEASSGILLLIATAVALIMANTALAGKFNGFWQRYFTLGFGAFTLSKPLLLWINDGLMAVFFFFVGLEIKRELMIGELSRPGHAALPVAAALGGMLFPALIYILFNHNTMGASGWGIPMATDIAFALGILMLLGKRVPIALKVFLTAVAIVDDLGAVLVIAFFYTSSLQWIYLGVGLAILAILFLLNRLGVRHPFFYGLLGFFLWLAFLKSGVHATIAGVLLAMTIPSYTRINAKEFLQKMTFSIRRFEQSCKPDEELWSNEEQQKALQTMEIHCHHAESPMQRMEHELRPWVSYFIMPVFALANAGLTFEAGSGSWILEPVSLGIVLGLVLGKPVGILLFSWISSRTGIATLPKGVKWKHMVGAGLLAGIGFTMSIFISSLAFSDTGFQSVAKTGIIIGSLIAGVLGVLVLRRTDTSEVG